MDGQIGITPGTKITPLLYRLPDGTHVRPGRIITVRPWRVLSKNPDGTMRGGEVRHFCKIEIDGADPVMVRCEDGASMMNMVDEIAGKLAPPSF